MASGMMKLLGGLALLVGAGFVAMGLSVPKAGWVAVPFLLLGLYLWVRAARLRFWLQGTFMYRQNAITVHRIDLSHALVELVRKPVAVKVHDPIHRRWMTIPLSAAMPPEEVKLLHDAIMSGQRFRRGKDVDRAAAVGAYLQGIA